MGLTSWKGAKVRKPDVVRIAEFSMAVPVVDHVVAHSPQIWGLMEAISEV
jgi:hypothetical protein